MSVAALLSTAGTAYAGSARDYLNAPVDSWLLNYNAGYTTSLTPEDGTDTVPGVRANVLAQSVVLTRIIDYWGRTGGFSLVLPYALIDTSAGPFRASTNGVSDVGFLWQMNIFGGPALTREQFQSFVPQTFSSFHLLVTTPIGFYQPSSPINPSANRWMISPTVNFSYTPDQGSTWIETYVAGRVFTDNSNYLVNRAQTLTQRPLLRLEEHVSRNVTDALWLSADAFYNLGGETSIDGIDQDNMANTLRIGAGMGPRLWRGADMGLNYERVVAKPASEPYFANRAIDRETALVGGFLRPTAAPESPFRVDFPVPKPSMSDRYLRERPAGIDVFAEIDEAGFDPPSQVLMSRAGDQHSARLFPGFDEKIVSMYATIVQTCIVHLIRHSMDFASWKDRKALAGALKTIYRAKDADAANVALTAFDASHWGQKYPAITQSWRRDWERVIPFFAFPEAVRRIVYTTNAIEALNAKLRRAVKIRGHFPNDDAAAKLLFLVLRQVAAEWKMPPREWFEAKTQFAILFGERFVQA
jgi:Transposase, Mutator family/Putative MetA-pathway of phenol degradation